jgi:hypothetical protein
MSATGPSFSAASLSSLSLHPCGNSGIVQRKNPRHKKYITSTNDRRSYKARLFASQSQKEPDWKLFAVVDDKEEPLTEAEVLHIFQDEEIES